MWLLEFPDASFDAELLKKLVERICRISAYEINWGNRVHTMDDHVFLTVFALIISAVLERDFPETVTVTEVTYSILRLLRYFCISPVSYTHLDVYKRQPYGTAMEIRDGVGYIRVK